MKPNLDLLKFVYVLAIFVLLSPLPILAQPIGSVDLQFSVDGGTVFTDSATVDNLENILLRIYFDNTGDAAATAAALAADLPEGFIRTTGSTTVCLEPTPGEFLCNLDAGQGGAIDEAAVWTDRSLTISPTAGLFGQGTGLTSGNLEIGKKRYLNIHDCHYFNGAERYFVTADSDISGTNVANAIDAAAACAAVDGAYALAGAEVRTADLLANRYLNYHECHYNFFTDHIIRVADGTATRASNDVDGAFNCAGTAGAHILHPDSGVTNFDLFGFRYFNFRECRFLDGGDVIALNSLFGIGSNTAAAPEVAPTCPSLVGAYALIDSDFIALDLLDSSRGRGFVQVQAQVVTGGGTYDIDATLDAAEFVPQVDTGTVTVVEKTTTAPIPSVDLMYSQTCGAVFLDTVEPFPGESFIARIYFDNTGDGAGTAASITTTLPDDYSLVAGTTRVCLEPAVGERICNDDPGQGGALDEGTLWTGRTLTVAPTAGLRGESTSATFGTLDIGRKRYLNLHECQYFDGVSDRFYLAVDQTGVNASNDPDLAATCGAAAHGGTLVDSVVSSLDLSAGSYLNIHECQYQFGADRLFVLSEAFTGTNISNQEDDVLSCEPVLGAHTSLPAESHIRTIDLTGDRYLNLHECVMINVADHIALSASGGNGTHSSNTANDTAICPSASGAHTFVAGAVAPVDLLDTTRGRGYVEFHIHADTVAGNFDQTAELSGNEFAAVSDTEQIQGDPLLLFRDGFECGTDERWPGTQF